MRQKHNANDRVSADCPYLSVTNSSVVVQTYVSYVFLTVMTSTQLPQYFSTSYAQLTTMHARTHPRKHSPSSILPSHPLRRVVSAGFTAVTSNECGENARPRLHTNLPCLNVIYCTRGNVRCEHILKKAESIAKK